VTCEQVVEWWRLTRLRRARRTGVRDWGSPRHRRTAPL